MTDHPLALLGQGHAPMRALQQLEPQLPLQFLDRTAQRRLGDVQNLGRFKNAACVMDGD